MKTVKLWVDDARNCPFIGNWKVAKDYDEAIQIMQEYNLDECWLDYDLSESHYSGNYETEKTGEDILDWMIENKKIPEKTFVHSLNPVGADRMCKKISEHFGHSNPEKFRYSYLKLINKLIGG